MSRIKLTHDQKTTLHTERKALEARIRDLKKALRGRPHGPEASDQQSTLSESKRLATALYGLLAQSRGRTHVPPERLEKDFARFRYWAKSYEQYWKEKRPMGAGERFGKLLVELEAATEQAPAPAQPAA